MWRWIKAQGVRLLRFGFGIITTRGGWTDLAGITTEITSIAQAWGDNIIPWQTEKVEAGETKIDTNEIRRLSESIGCIHLSIYLSDVITSYNREAIVCVTSTRLNQGGRLEKWLAKHYVDWCLDVVIEMLDKGSKSFVVGYASAGMTWLVFHYASAAFSAKMIEMSLSYSPDA